MRRKNGETYPHVYEKLITKELFDTCQDVKSGKTRARHRKSLIPFVLREMLACKHCNCVYSPEVKIKQTKLGTAEYIYLRPTKSQGDCAYCFNVKEELVLGQIESIIKSIHIPEPTLLQIKGHLKSLVQEQYHLQQKEIRLLESKLQVSNERLKSIRTKFIDNLITSEENATWSNEETANKIAIEEKIRDLRLIDNDFEREVMTTLNLANQSYELFKSSDVDEKRRIISLLLPNLFLDGKNLDFTLRKPFDDLLNLVERPDWLPSFNIFRNKQDDILSTMNRPMMEGVRLCLVV